MRGQPKADCLVPDANGNLVPRDPGKVIPITELPPLHPAVVYLKERGFDLHSLYNQFKCSYCYEEQPEIPDKGIFYKSYLWILETHLKVELYSILL